MSSNTIRGRDNNKEKDDETAYTAFSKVDDLVSKPVLGSDGAAAWQQFSSSSSQTRKGRSSTSHAPTAPLKKLDRAATGFSSWTEEREHEIELRRKQQQQQQATTTGAANELHTGYTHFKQKPTSNTKLTKKERKRIEQRQIGKDQEYYIPSNSTFTGWKKDYVFTTKESHGTGYYFDGMDSFKQLQRGEDEEDLLIAADGGATTTTTGDNNASNNKKKKRGGSNSRESKKTTKDNNDGSNNDDAQQQLMPPLKKKKKKKKTKQPQATIVEDPNNPMEVVARVLAARHASSRKDLPQGWEATTDTTTQQTYYYNRTTGERTWETPTINNNNESQQSQAATVLPNGWQAVKDPNTGKEYYYKASTGETVWERPSTS